MRTEHRHILAGSVILLTTAMAAHAQVDINRMIQEQMARQGKSGEVKIEDDTSPFVPNTFIGSFRMENHIYKDGVETKDSPTNMHYWSSPEMTLVKMEVPEQKGQEMRILTDLKGKWQYMLMDDGKGNRTAMKSPKKTITVTGDKDGKEKTLDGEITVTEETKMIEGHLCKKVVSKSADGTWTGWMAEGVPGPFNDMARTVRTGDPGLTQRMGELGGFVMEFEWQDAQDTDSMHAYMRDVVVGKVDPAVFSIEGYAVMEMPSFGK